MEEKKDTEEKQKEQNEEEKKPIDNERQKAFELIYSKIKIIKEKHKKDKENTEQVPQFSLHNYNIDKVLCDNKLKDIFHLLEPNMPTMSIKFMSSSVSSQSSNRNTFNKYYSLFNDINTFNERKSKKIINKSLFTFKSKISNAIKNTTPPSITNSGFKKNERIKKEKLIENDYLSRTRSLISHSKEISFAIPKKWESKYLFKYNSTYYKSKLEQLDERLDTVGDYLSIKQRQRKPYRLTSLFEKQKPTIKSLSLW